MAEVMMCEQQRIEDNGSEEVSRAKVLEKQTVNCQDAETWVTAARPSKQKHLPAVVRAEKNVTETRPKNKKPQRVGWGRRVKHVGLGKKEKN